MSSVPEGYREATCYLQIEARGSGPYGSYYPRSSEATAVRMTSKKPDKPIPGAVVVKVRIQIPRAAFEPLQPEAVVRVPAEFAQHVVEVIADDATEDRGPS